MSDIYSSETNTMNMEEDNEYKESNNGNVMSQSECKEPPNKKFRPNEEVDIRFLISSKEAGAIIGKGGVNINFLRKTYKSSVTVPDSPGPERVLSIITSMDKLNNILNNIMCYIGDRPCKETEREVELRLLIHTSHAGGIIGKGGSKIRELRDQTKAAIKVFTQCCPLSTERVCAVHGTPSIVINAIKIIFDIILSTQIKGIIKLYDPYNFDIYSASEYGGYTEPGPTGAYRSAGRISASTSSKKVDMTEPWEINSFQNHPPPMDVSNSLKPWSRVGSMTYNSSLGTDKRTLHSASASHNYQRWMPSGSNDFRQSSLAFYHRFPPGSSLLSGVNGTPYWSDVMPDKGSQNIRLSTGLTIPLNSQISGWTTNPYENKSLVDYDSNLRMETVDGLSKASLSVPNSVAGAIIGKKGARIRNVRRDSGADISIEKNLDPNKDRVITIRGTPFQVKLAYGMLQTSIIENSGY